MTAYRLLEINLDSSAGDSTYFDADDDGAAITAAMRRFGELRLEVWREKTHIATIKSPRKY